MTLATPERSTAGRTKLATIDCDIHNYLPNDTAIRPFLSKEWQAHFDEFGPRIFHGNYFPLSTMHAARTDSWPPQGGIPGSNLEFMREQLLDRWELEYGILLPLLGSGKQMNLEWGAAYSRAANDWQIAEWLEPEPRLRASMVVPYEAPDLAVQEIERLGEHPGFVQVEFESRTLQPLGQRKYWPIYRAAAERGLPIGMHFGAQGGWPITGAGHPSFYLEYHAGQLTSFQDQVISLVVEGVFERIPDLKFVLIEGGFGWLPPLMWRLDRAWTKLKAETPFLKRLPSEVIRQHFWVTTQPVEEPEDPNDFAVLLADLAMNDRVMFSTDYPHWDFDAPDAAIPTTLPLELRRKIMAENARALYHLPSPLPPGEGHPQIPSPSGRGLG